ncbi:MAG: 50S ribosomal protein L21e [Candidatus Woesearchaeota archaeon]
MVQRIGGLRRKTRHLMSKPHNKKGKISFKNILSSYKEGDKVILIAEPSTQKGSFFRRFSGKSGVIKGKQGNCYKVQIMDNKKQKIALVSSIHLRRV